MKILIYSLNFYPDKVGIGKYSGEMAQWLNKKGNDIKVICAPNYFPKWESFSNKYKVEKLREIRVFRCPIWTFKNPNGLSRLILLISFALSSLPVLFSQKKWNPELVITISPTLFCAFGSLLFTKLINPKTKNLIHIQDFEIDAAFNLKIIKGNTFKKVAFFVERFLINNFDLITTISNGMYKKALTKGISEEKLYLFPNWVNTNKIKNSNFNERKNNFYRKKLELSDEKIVIMYSGSMNKKQGLEIIPNIIKALRNYKNIVWIMGGEGPTKENLKKELRDIVNVYFFPLQEEKYIESWLNFADIHILPQKKEVENLVFPSKILGIMSSGRPVISTARKNSDLGMLIENIGIRVDPGDINAFIKALILLAKNKDLRYRLGQKARFLVEENFSKAKVLNNFEELLQNNFKN